MNTDTMFPIAMDLLVKSVGILLLAFTLQALWRSASAAHRCLVWGAAFVILALLPATLLFTPRWSFEWERSSQSPLPPPMQASVTNIQPDWVSSMAVPAEAVPTRWHFSQLNAAQMAFGIWIAGGALVLAWRGLGAWQVRSLRRQSVRLEEARILELVRGIVQECCIGRRIELRESARVSVPLTWGVFNPVLLLPREAQSWDGAALEAALRHELGHIRHLDALTRWLMSFVGAALWPNLLVWFAAKAWRTAQEQACDDLVLRAGTATQQYAMQLLDAARSMRGNAFRHAPVMAMAKPSTLETRLSAIMDENRNRRPLRRHAWFAGGGTVMLLLVLCAALQVRAQDKEKGKTEAPVSTASTKIPSPEVALRLHLFDSPLGALPRQQGEDLTERPSYRGAAVLEREDLPALLKHAEQIKDVTKLSSPTVTTRSGQEAVIQTGKNTPDGKPKADAPDFEGLHVELKPTVQPDGKAMNVGFDFLLRQVKEKTADGKPALGERHISTKFGELHISTMIARMAPGTTMFFRGVHPTDPEREVLVLLTADLVAGEPGVQAEENAPHAPRTRVKAEKIILPTLKFRDATLADILDFLRLKSAQLDPDKQGVNIIFADPMPNEARITLDLRDVPLSEALHYVTELAKVKFRYDDNAITIGIAQDGDVSVTKMYRLPQDVAGGMEDAMVWLQKQGVALSQGSQASVDKEKATLLVKSKTSEMKEVDAIVEKLSSGKRKTTIEVGPDTTVSADSIAVDPKSQDIVATGGVTVSKGNVVTQAEKMVVQQGGKYYAIGPATTAISPMPALANHIILPQVQFKNATVAEAVEFLSIKSKQFDPEKRGVSIVLRPPRAGAPLVQMTLDLKDVPLSEVVKYVAELAGLKVKYEPYAILLEAK